MQIGALNMCPGIYALIGLFALQAVQHVPHMLLCCILPLLGVSQ